MGIGLLELLISLALCTLLTGLLIDQIVRSRQQIQHLAHRMNQTMELQWLSDLLRSRVRTAGFTPCLRLDLLVTFDARQKPQSLAWFEWHADSPRCILRRMGDEVRAVVVRNPRELQLDGPAVPLNRPIMIADCTHAEVHRQAEIFVSAHGARVLLQHPLHYPFQPPIYYAEWVSETFFMREQAFYYRHHRSDKLSTHVVDFSVRLSTREAHTWLEWVLTLADGELWPLITRVRAV